MKPSRLQLLRYVASEMSCNANPAFNPEKAFDPAESQPSVKVSVNLAEKSPGAEANLWKLELTVAMAFTTGENVPYSFKVSLLGFFAFHSNSTSNPETEEQFVRVNGSSMLYGAAREIVRSMTSRGPWEELFLPGVSFYDPPKAETPKPPPTKPKKQEESAD